MSALFILVPISILFLLLAAVVFVWSVNHDQMDDLDKAGEQILFDDEPSESKADEDKRNSED